MAIRLQSFQLVHIRLASEPTQHHHFDIGATHQKFYEKVSDAILMVPWLK